MSLLLKGQVLSSSLAVCGPTEQSLTLVFLGLSSVEEILEKKNSAKNHSSPFPSPLLS